MNNKKEVIFYENVYYGGQEFCEYISDKGILRSDNGCDATSYPTGVKEIIADEDKLTKFWKKLDKIDIWNWNKKYIDERAPTCGNQWKLSLRNKVGNSKYINGYEMYPHNFQKFINALNQLFQIKIEIEYNEDNR